MSNVREQESRYRDSADRGIRRYFKRDHMRLKLAVNAASERRMALVRLIGFIPASG